MPTAVLDVPLTGGLVGGVCPPSGVWISDAERKSLFGTEERISGVVSIVLRIERMKGSEVVQDLGRGRETAKKV